VIDELFAYQTDLERRLKQTVEYQVGTTLRRVLRKAIGHRAA
jgi:hypothetical protein